jgi:hypothetical protein
MNAHQKTGILVIRLAALLAVVLGCLGLIYWAAVVLGLAPPSSRASLGVSACWILGGLALWILSRPLGRLLGRGLE